MTGKSIIKENAPKLEEFAGIAVQPIAIAVSKLLRARSDQEIVDASLKAGEVITRYLAILSLASYRARKRSDTDETLTFPLFGNLSWGHFLQVIQKITSLNIEHPINKQMGSFRPAKKGKSSGKFSAERGLESLLQLRNEQGHNLTSMSNAAASILLKEKTPVNALVQVLESVRPLITMPLLLVEEQLLEKGKIRARVLWLMGETQDPIPHEIGLESAVLNTRTPYVSLGAELLMLSPFMVWDAIEKREIYGLLLINSVGEDKISFQSIYADKKDATGDYLLEFKSSMEGETIASESVTLDGGKTLFRYWGEEFSPRLGQRGKTQSAIPWDSFDQESVDSYTRLLTIFNGKDETPLRETLVSLLWDGREKLSEDEENQALLLFGTDDSVRKLLNRDLIDLRVVKNPASRWDDRQLICSNVMTCLKKSLDFFGRNLQLTEASVEKLQNTSGAPDFVAVREALINQFIHQDYFDKHASAQIEIRPDEVTFFNPGHSFLSNSDLIDGGKSYARNPLVARALRLVGFAELAGSGLRALQAVWRESKRKPPRFESNKDSNTFSLTLYWKHVPNLFDTVWKTRLGVKLTPEQAQIMNLSGDVSGVTVEQAASGTGLTVEEAGASVDYLVRQMLVQRRGERYFVQEHLRELVSNA